MKPKIVFGIIVGVGLVPAAFAGQVIGEQHQVANFVPPSATASPTQVIGQRKTFSTRVTPTPIATTKLHTPKVVQTSERVAVKAIETPTPIPTPTTADPTPTDAPCPRPTANVISPCGDGVASQPVGESGSVARPTA